MDTMFRHSLLRRRHFFLISIKQTALASSWSPSSILNSIGSCNSTLSSSTASPPFCTNKQTSSFFFIGWVISSSTLARIKEVCERTSAKARFVNHILFDKCCWGRDKSLFCRDLHQGSKNRDYRSWTDQCREWSRKDEPFGGQVRRSKRKMQCGHHRRSEIDVTNWIFFSL